MTKYFKTDNMFLSVEEDTDGDYNAMMIDDMKANGVHLDWDYSWHYHSYNFDLIDGHTVEDIINLMKNESRFETTLALINNYMDIEDDVDTFKETLQEVLGYIDVEALYKLVNDDESNKIVAYTVDGFSQGESAFVWFEDVESENLKDSYTPEFVSDLLFATWYEVNQVEANGEYMGGVDNVTYMDDEDLNKYMLSTFNAVPAKHEATITLS